MQRERSAAWCARVGYCSPAPSRRTRAPRSPLPDLTSFSLFLAPPLVSSRLGELALARSLARGSCVSRTTTVLWGFAAARVRRLGAHPRTTRPFVREVQIAAARARPAAHVRAERLPELRGHLRRRRALPRADLRAGAEVVAWRATDREGWAVRWGGRRCASTDIWASQPLD